MAKRKIIQIERHLCNGCGLCTTACAEGALELDSEKKAVLVKEIYCDGLGACLDLCPTGALRIVEREIPAYDARAAHAHVLRTKGAEAARLVHGMSHGASKGLAPNSRPPSGHPISARCPSSQSREVTPAKEGLPPGGASGISELSQWPIQLHLVSPQAPYFRKSALLIAADCTAFALGNFHAEILRGKKLIIACPKLDETEGYVAKLAELLKDNEPRSLTVAIMTVPCCSGLARIVEQAIETSGVKIKLEKTLIHIDGRLIS